MTSSSQYISFHDMVLFQIRGIQYFAQVKPIYDNHTWRHRRLQGKRWQELLWMGQTMAHIADVCVFISPIYQYSWYCTISNERHSAIYTQAQVKCMYHNQNMTNTSHLYIIQLLLSDTAAMEGSFNNKLYIHYEEQGDCSLLIHVVV